MQIVGRYSFNGGVETVNAKYPGLLKEVEYVIQSIDASLYKDKVSKEKTMVGRMLYSPDRLNKAFKHEFGKLGWFSKKILCKYPTEYYVHDAFKRLKLKGNVPYRDMDFVKDKLGIEVQFGKYSFMVYNVCAKMTIFKNLGFIDTGIEIVPIKSFAEHMSTGVSYFEQFVWDLNARGVSNIDIPVLILGISDDASFNERMKQDQEQRARILNLSSEKAPVQ
jgi:hypothetical protein